MRSGPWQRCREGAARLGRDRSGTALLELGLTMPILLLMSLTGAELTNYITVKMRVSQIALHLADNAARIGTGSQLSAKTISEADINDLFTGANLQGGELDMQTNGRMIVSSLQPVANPNTTSKFKIAWQRCKGNKTTHASSYGIYNTSSGQNMDGMGPTGRQITAPDYGATMFVEIYYEYKPIFQTGIAPTTSITEIASMVVRDKRDLSDDSNLGAAATHPQGIYKVTGVTASTC